MTEWRKRHGRRGRINWVTLVLLAGGIFSAVMAYCYVPAWANLYEVHEIVRGSALQWYANESKEAAVDELYYRLEKDGFDYIGEEECKVYADGDLRVVHCEWEYYAYYPLEMGYGHLYFSSKAEVDTTGGVNHTGGLRRADWFNKL